MLEEVEQLLQYKKQRQGYADVCTGLLFAKSRSVDLLMGPAYSGGPLQRMKLDALMFDACTNCATRSWYTFAKPDNFDMFSLTRYIRNALLSLLCLNWDMVFP